MRAGGGKQKGAQFEREICKRLSLWVSNGKDEDLFWRSAMSGGRASVAMKVNKKLRRQAGDITATSIEGCTLTDRFYIECKHVKSLGLEAFLFNQNGPLQGYWDEASEQAEKHDKDPMIIAKQNRMDPLVIISKDSLRRLIWPAGSELAFIRTPVVHIAWLSDVLSKPYEPVAE